MIAGRYRFLISDSGLRGLFFWPFAGPLFRQNPHFADLDTVIDLTLPQNKDTADSYRG